MEYTSALCLVSCTDEVIDGEDVKKDKSLKSITDLLGPCSCVTTKDGLIAICEWRGHRVSVVDADGDAIVRFGNRVSEPSAGSLKFKDLLKSKYNSSSQLFGSKDGELHEPTGVAAVGNDRLAVCDSQNNRIQIFKTSGVHVGSVTMMKGSERDRLRLARHPYDIAVSEQSGAAYVSHPFSNTVAVLSPEMVHCRSISLQTVQMSEAFTPLGLAVDRSDDTLYACDRDNSVVHKFSTLGDSIATYKADHLHYPLRVAVDANGIVYVTYSYTTEIAMFSNDGQYIGRFGGDCEAVSRLKRPKGITVARDNIYICDSISNEVAIF